MRLALSTTLLIFSLLLITTTAHPSGHPRRRHANRQRRSRVQLSTSTINTPTTAITTPQNGITNDNTTEPTALGLWTPSSASVAGTSNANAAAAAAPQASASASALGLFTPPSEDEGTPDSEAGSEGYGGWGGGGGGGGGKKGGWGGGSWRGGGWGGVQSQQQSQPSSAPVASDMGVDISAGVDVSILKAGGGAGYGGYDAQSTAPASQPYAYQPPESQPYSEAPVPSISSPSYVAPPATTSYERPPIYSSNYIEVTEWYTPSTPGTSSYQAPALSGQTDEGAIPTSQMYSPPPVAGTPTPTLPNSPSAANTGYSSSTAGGYSSNAVVTSGGRVVHTSSWKSSWTNSWSNAPSTTSQAPVATSAPQDDDQRKFVDCHNQWRNQYGAGNVSWGDELASYANTHASVCASMTHTNGPYGENLAAGTDGFMDIISSIGMWMDEASDYDASNPTYSHFTQVVWKETTTIGCAAINCGANTGMAGQIYIMCEYHPRGNVIGAFAQNVGKK